MNFTRVIHRLREQIHFFAQGCSALLSKPKLRFLEEMLYGIQAARDVKLSNISRALGETIGLKKTEERLSRHLKHEDLDQQLNEHVAGQASSRIHRDTLLIIDPSDIRKTYARKMPYLSRVRDGSTGEIVPGYWTCHIVACEPKSRRMLPLHLSLWSQKAPEFDSENTQILRAVDTVHTSVKDRGIWVMDRGGDREKLFRPFLERGLRFIVRLTAKRDLIYRGKRVHVLQLAEDCPMYFAEAIVKENRTDEKTYHLEYGFRRVRLPGREEDLYLVVVKGFGAEPLMLLTNLPMRKSRRLVWQAVEGYLCRWMVEETIRFIKQAYHLEDLRVLDYQRLKNMVALVLMAVFFAAVQLGEELKLAVLARQVMSVAKRFFGVPDFHYYAIAEGISTLLRHSRRGPLLVRTPPEHDIGQLLLFSPT
jgi:hypothetical protein